MLKGCRNRDSRFRHSSYQKSRIIFPLNVAMTCVQFVEYRKNFIMYSPSKSPSLTTQEVAVFLVFNDVQTSFNRGYFGPVKCGNVLGRLEYLGRMKGCFERRKAGHG